MFGNLLLMTAMTMGQSGCPEPYWSARERDAFEYGCMIGTRDSRLGYRGGPLRRLFEQLRRDCGPYRSNGGGQLRNRIILEIRIDTPTITPYLRYYE